MLLTDMIPLLERLDEWYHEGKIPEFVGKPLCNLLDSFYENWMDEVIEKNNRRLD